MCALLIIVDSAAAQTTTPCIQNPGAPNPWPNPGAAAGGYIVLGNMGNPNVFSVSLWVNPAAVQNPQSIMLDCNHGGNANWVIQSINGGATWAFLNCNFVLQANRWQHLLCTYNNGIAKVFVNGALVSQCNWVINWTRLPFNVHLGNWPEGGRRFSGMVDELYITNNLLYDADFIPIEVVSNAAILPNTFGLWHFDEAAGLVTQNAANGVNAAINNWVWNTRTLNGPFANAYQIAADLIEFGSPTTTRLLTGGGTGNVVLRLPSADGTLAVTPMTLGAPTGNVVQYAADTIPTGFIKSNGQNVSRTQYATLFNQIGTTYSPGDGASTFGLPDVGPIPTNGLVGWWPFNGNANDESGNALNGVINGSVLTSDRFGYGASAYVFDGNDWIEVAANANLNPGAGTISVWFKTAQARNQDIIYKTGKVTGPLVPGQVLNENYAIGWYDNPAATIEGCVKYNSNCIAGAGWQKAKPNVTYADDKWHNVIMTWGDGSVKYYVDGRLVAEKVTPVNLADVCAGGPFIIGGGWAVPTGTFIGSIDDIAVYNRVVTAAERNRLFGADSPRLQSIIKH